MKKIAIVGAGPAGLTAAYCILNKSKEYEVTIYEKSENIGGLSCTYEFDGNKVDVGGHRFFTRSNRVLQLWQEVLPVEDGKMLIKDRLSHILFKGKLYPYPLKVNKDLLRQLGLKESAKVTYGYLKAKIKKKKVNNLEEFYINRFGKELYTLFFEKYTEKLWGIPVRKLSAAWGEQRIQKLSLKSLVKKNNKDRTMIEQFYYPTYGSGQIWEQLAKRIEEMGGKIVFDANVIDYEYEKKSIQAIIYENKKMHQRIAVDYVISTATLKEVAMNIASPKSKEYMIAEKLKYRNMIIAAMYIEKDGTGAIYEELSNDMWIYVQNPEVAFGRIQILNNWSVDMLNDNKGVLLEVEYYCDIMDSIWKASDVDIIKMSRDGLSRIGMISKNASLISYFVKKIENAYPIYTETYDKVKEIRNWVNSFENLYCIGRNGQHHYNNMDHSMETAFEAIDILLGRKKDKERIWNVNSDDEYIEKRA